MSKQVYVNANRSPAVAKLAYEALALLGNEQQQQVQVITDSENMELISSTLPGSHESANYSNSSN